MRYTAVAKTVLLFKTKMDDVCPVCGISLLRINLARHLRTHDENPQFRCEICDKFFKTNNSLSQHKRTHRKPEDIPCLFPSEQEGEHLHQIFNSIERSYKSVRNKEERYWLMLENYENKLYCTK